MSAVVYIALVGWPFVVLVLFSQLPARQAAFAAIIAGWMFLPMADIAMPAGPAYSKRFVTSFAVVLAVLIFDAKSLVQFRLHMIDLPIFLMCLTPIGTSLANDLGFYDGLCEVHKQTFMWGVPYLIGRIYVKELADIRELVVAIVLGVAVYVPFCLTELIFSPQLHRWIYGYHQHSFLQHTRDGGYRPMVFMEHGLMVSFWMAMGTVAGGWLWLRGGVKRICRLQLNVLVSVTLLVTIGCKSTGAVVHLCVGLMAIAVTRLTNSRWPIICLVLIPIIFTTARVSKLLPREVLTSFASQFQAPDRVGSWNARLIQEDLFSEHALKRPIFGWGEFGRNFPTDPVTGKKLTRGVDGYWTIVVSRNGLMGLAAFLGAGILPVLALILRMPKATVKSPEMAPVLAAVTIVAIFFIECLPDGMINPVFIMLLGGVASLAITRRYLLSEEKPLPAQPVIISRRQLYPYNNCLFTGSISELRVNLGEMD